MAVAALGLAAAGCNDGKDDTEQAQSVATEAADNARDAVTNGADNARDTATDAADDARDAVTDAADDARDTVTSADLPDVDWDKYGQETKDRIDKLADDANCDGLRAELSQVEANDTDLTEYVKAQIAKVPCSTP